MVICSSIYLISHMIVLAYTGIPAVRCDFRDSSNCLHIYYTVRAPEIIIHAERQGEKGGLEMWGGGEMHWHTKRHKLLENRSMSV